MDIEKRIEIAIGYISQMPVTGNNQELAAMAKQELRETIIALRKEKATDGEQ